MNIQKILPACAVAMGVVLALATSAFKQASKDKSGQTLYTFKYNPPSSNPYSSTNVADKSKWSYGAASPACDDHDQRACTIMVHEDYVDDPNGSPSLKNDFTITPAEYDTNDYYVGSTSDVSATIVNKQVL